VDTNVWVSAFLNPHGFPATLLRSWIDGAFQVAISAPLEDLTRDPQLAGYLAARGVSVMTVARFLQHLAESPPQPA